MTIISPDLSEIVRRRAVAKAALEGARSALRSFPGGRREWSAAELAELRAWQDMGLRPKEIANLVERSPEAIANRAAKEGRPFGQARPTQRPLPDRGSADARRSTLAAVLKDVCSTHRVWAGDLCGRSREGLIVRIRQECMYRMWMETDRSTAQIGRALGGRDHTTVVHGIRTHAGRLEASAG